MSIVVLEILLLKKVYVFVERLQRLQLKSYVGMVVAGNEKIGRSWGILVQNMHWRKTSRYWRWMVHSIWFSRRSAKLQSVYWRSIVCLICILNGVFLYVSRLSKMAAHMLRCVDVDVLALEPPNCVWASGKAFLLHFGPTLSVDSAERVTLDLKLYIYSTSVFVVRNWGLLECLCVQNSFARGQFRLTYECGCKLLHYAYHMVRTVVLWNPYFKCAVLIVFLVSVLLVS